MLAYETLKKINEDIHPFKQIDSLLEWDMRVLMPAGAAEERIRMQQVIHHVIRATREREQIDLLLETAWAERDSLQGWDLRNLELMRHSRRVQNALPSSLIVKLDHATLTCQTLWPQARREKNWELMAEPFAVMVGLLREKAKLLADLLERKPYDALLYGYTRGYTSAELDPLFSAAKAALMPLLRHGRDPDLSELPPLSREQQMQLAHTMIARIGFDFRFGRIDYSEKAFHKWTDADSRIAISYRPDNFMVMVSSAIHEAGHALHKFHRPAAWLAQPVGTPGDFCLRESMAFMWQNQACRTAQFYDILAVELTKMTGHSVMPATLRTAMCPESAHPLRVGHGDVNYLLHIIMRYEIERDLIAGNLDPEALPDAWFEKVRETLHLDVPDDGQGCLQDIHWFKGAFGYFPCYALGYVYAAQLFAKARADIPGLDNTLFDDNAAALRGWLAGNVYAHANSMGGREVVEKALGAPVDVQSLIAQMQAAQC